MHKTRSSLVDDLDGSPGATTVLFGLDGCSYEIDLSAPNAERLRHVFAGYVERARVVGRAATDRGLLPSAQRGAAGGMRKAATPAARCVGHGGDSSPSARAMAQPASGKPIPGDPPATPATDSLSAALSRPDSSGEPARAGSARSPGAARDGVPGEVRQAVLDVLVALQGVLGSLGARRRPDDQR